MSKKDIGYITIILILIITIFILIFTTKFGKIQNNKLNPTGNVDVFNIDIDCVTKTLDEKDTKVNTDSTVKECFYTDSKGVKRKISLVTTSSSDNSNNTNNSNTDNNYTEPEDPEEPEEMIYVKDKQGSYTYKNNLKIFNNAAFNYASKIAPGVCNTYNFEVHNNSDMKLEYNIKFIEESEYTVNMKYRIRKNGKYIAGDKDTYVSINEINLQTDTINSNSTDKYSLDWKWFDDDENDTIAGENMTEEYKLKLNINFEQV